jgi:ATP-dependent Lon protease
MINEELPDSLPILPLRNMVLFPGVVIPITAGRDKSIKLINDANAAGKIIGVVAQKMSQMKIPQRRYPYRDRSQNFARFKMPDGNTTVILQGKNVLKLNRLLLKIRI